MSIYTKTRVTLITKVCCSNNPDQLRFNTTLYKMFCVYAKICSQVGIAKTFNPPLIL